MAKILVADDDAGNLRLAVTILGNAGHTVLTATDGASAVAAALMHAPDLVLMDVQMSGMDGIKALARLRADPRTSTMKVVAFTALAMIGDAERLLASGFDAYIEKPVRYKHLHAEIQRLLGDPEQAFRPSNPTRPTS